jgi:predicted aspartyl protease
MIDDMGIFRTTVGIRPTPAMANRTEVENVMVDTGSEYNWFPAELLAEIGVAPMRIDRFETADGHVIERPVGFAIVDVAGVSAGTVVVFAQPGDMVLLGAHGLEGMNLRIDLVKKELVPAGPVPAALVA